jgi:hypothetical protein
MLLLSVLFSIVVVDSAQVIVYTDGAGDSLSVAYNAVRNGLPNNSSGESGTLNCNNGAISGRSWGSELPSTTCPAPSSELVRSFAKQQFCGPNRGTGMTSRNSAASGATMLANMKSQANTIATNLRSVGAGRKQVLIFQGHNDLCNGVNNKINNNCSNTDLDSQNYCRTAQGAFEREFRNGLDSLITIQNVTVSTVGPARVSQLCSVRSANMCQALLYLPGANSCSNAWSRAGICTSLTADCSNTRIQDAYTFEKGYRDTMIAVTQEYQSIPVGSASKSFSYNGKSVGGAIKASGVQLIYSDAVWMSPLNPGDVSCCDCFHASVQGQQKLADTAWNGLTCSATTPCCTDSNNALTDGSCSTRVTDGRNYPGVQL